MGMVEHVAKYQTARTVYLVTKSKWAFKLGPDSHGGKRTHHIHLTMLAGTKGTRLAQTKNGIALKQAVSAL